MRARETMLVAAREVRDSVRNRWFILSALSFLALSLALSLLGLAGAQRSGLAGYDRSTASLLNLAILFIPLVTLSLGGLGIAGELEDGSLGMLLSQPITRAEVYFGKFVGLLGAMWASILLGFGSTGVIVGMWAGGGNIRVFLGLVGVALLLATTTLALGTLLSVTLRSRGRVIGAAFAAWLILVYVSDLGAIGLVIAKHLGPGQVFAIALFNPVEQARVLGTLSLSNRLDVLGPVGVYGLDLLGRSGVASLLVFTLVGMAIVPLIAGFVLFRKTIVN